MLNRIFPRQFDNRYRGNPLALWLFYPLLFMNAAIALVAIFKDDGGAQSADGVALDTFGAGAAATVIGAIALLGFAKLLLAAIYAMAALRYRAMIPLMYVLIVADQIGHKAILAMKPMVRVAGTAGGSYVAWTLFAVSVVGLVLSLLGKREPQAGAIGDVSSGR